MSDRHLGYVDGSVLALRLPARCAPHAEAGLRVRRGLPGPWNVPWVVSWNGSKGAIIRLRPWTRGSNTIAKRKANLLRVKRVIGLVLPGLSVRSNLHGESREATRVKEVLYAPFSVGRWRARAAVEH